MSDYVKVQRLIVELAQMTERAERAEADLVQAQQPPVLEGKTIFEWAALADRLAEALGE